MRRYVGLNIFCAVLTLVFSGASFAAESAGEYRAPITGAKLGPVQPVERAQPAQPAMPAQPASPAASGQAAAAAGAFAPSQSAAAGQPTPWPSGGMAPYSSFGSMPGAAAGSASGSGPNPGPNSGSNSGPMYNQNSGASATSPMNSPAGVASNVGGMTGTAAAPQSAPSQSAGPSPAPGYAPYASPGAVLSGTGQMENYGEDRGIATQYRDPQTGDIITSVVPPSPPEQQNYGTFFIAPQIYPDGNQWGGNYNGSMPRPGQQYMPPVIWQPGTQQDNNRHRNDDRRHDRRSDNRYSNRPGSQGDSSYDQRGSGKGRDGGEWR